MSELRVGVVGYGVMGQRHVRAILGVPGVELVGVADGSGTVAPVPVLRSLDGLLALGIDACLIATPTWDHLPSAQSLAGAGVHLLIEKPLALTPAQCALIIKAADIAGVLALAGHVERFHPTIQALRSLVRSGVLGPLLEIETWNQGGPPRNTCGGVVLDLGVHDFDLMGRLTGMAYRPGSLTSAPVGDIPSDEAALVSALIGETRVRHRLSWHSAARVRRVAVCGERGTAVADLVAGTFSVDLAGHARRDQVAAASDPLTRQFEAFRDAVLGRDGPADRPPVASLADAAHCVALACSVLPTGVA